MGQDWSDIQFRADRFTFSTNYTQSAVRGSSPFYFDQFLQGNKSANIQGDVKINKWLTVGGGYGYNLDSKLPVLKIDFGSHWPPRLQSAAVSKYDPRHQPLWFRHNLWPTNSIQEPCPQGFS
jgi:hypothetical protein